MSELVLSETADRVCTVTLNRPDARNAMNSELQRALADALAATEAGTDADVVIVTGADPAFCAGLDLRELGSTGANLRGGEHPNPFTVLWTMSKPVLGAVNGAAVTGSYSTGGTNTRASEPLTPNTRRSANAVTNAPNVAPNERV